MSMRYDLPVCGVRVRVCVCAGCARCVPRGQWVSTNMTEVTRMKDVMLDGCTFECAHSPGMRH
jgi:hypothetical protein